MPRTVHGAASAGKKTAEYSAWQGLKSRCYHTGNIAYGTHGGRGIRVCDRWINDFHAFLSDMGPRPTPQHTVERMDNNGNYEPSNCRWATRAEQSANRRPNRLLTFNGRTQFLRAWAREVGISPLTLTARLRLGWPLGRALTTPPRRPRNGDGGRFAPHFSPPSR